MNFDSTTSFSKKLSFLHRIPIEWYALVLPFFALAVVFLLVHPGLFGNLGGLGGLLTQLHTNFFSPMFFLVGWYFAVRLLYDWAMARIDSGRLTSTQHAGTPNTREHIRSFFSITWLFVTYLLLMIPLVILIAWVYASAELVAVREFSMLYADWDVALGGASIYAHIIQFFDTYPFMSLVISYAYMGLPAVLGVMGVILAITSTRLFRESMLAFFLIALFSIPFWHSAPSVSPSHYLREGVAGEVAERHRELAEHTKAAVTSASAPYRESMAILEIAWGTREHAPDSFAVSTNPSMHVAWGLLCVIYAFMVRRWLGFLLLGYQTLNMIGTVFFLQHYLIDIPTGLILMVLVILVSRALIAYEEAYLTVNGDTWFRGPALLQSDARAFLKTFLRDLRSLRARLS